MAIFLIVVASAAIAGLLLWWSIAAIDLAREREALRKPIPCPKCGSVEASLVRWEQENLQGGGHDGMHPMYNTHGYLRQCEACGYEFSFDGGYDREMSGRYHIPGGFKRTVQRWSERDEWR